MPFSPITAWLTLVFLASVLVLMAFDFPDGTFTIAAIPIVAICLTLGWRAARGAGAPAQAPSPPP